ncbi:MAG: PEP/pyruvate-binding domain-containing protein [Bacteroidota bacterium]
MSKLSQLETLAQLGLPTPPFESIAHADFLSQNASLSTKIKAPLAVRSSFEDEDGIEKSYAGHFHTELDVEVEAFREAVVKVFASYPKPEGQKVIVQEMIAAQYSGVLFAYRKAVWKLEYVPGAGENLVSGKLQPESMLLPRFAKRDLFWQKWFPSWQIIQDKVAAKMLHPALMRLSVHTQKLLAHYEQEAPYGLDIEFCVDCDGKLYILQSRPITTADDAEEVLTSANHKEILPPHPSRFMTGLIRDCSQDLFAYYQRMDPSLSERDFIELASGMPWINLSALLDVMTSWGLPSALVCESVGADDPYRIGLRPWQSLSKIGVFFRLLGDQIGIVGRTKKWVKNTGQQLEQNLAARQNIWELQADLAFKETYQDMRKVYIDLVSHMQALTAAMSGPVKVLDKLGVLSKLMARSASTEYLYAFQAYQGGQMSWAEFVDQYGHRGFYESDLGQARFAELSSPPAHAKAGSVPRSGNHKSPWYAFFFAPIISLIHTREWLRHESMRFFFLLRKELLAHSPEAADFGQYYPEDWQSLLKGANPTISTYEAQSGWDLDSFLHNRVGRRLPISSLTHIKSGENVQEGLGIYPGKVRGQIWKVSQASQGSIEKPDFERSILLTESLDPGWIPYFVQVDGVLSYVGGLLSHASIILRESQKPAITQMPRDWQFETGDWVEMDGKTGEVVLLEKLEQAPLG